MQSDFFLYLTGNRFSLPPSILGGGDVVDFHWDSYKTFGFGFAATCLIRVNLNKERKFLVLTLRAFVKGIDIFMPILQAGCKRRVANRTDFTCLINVERG